MKEKQPVVLKVTAARNPDVPELKRIVCCDNPATGECLNVCYLEDGGRHVLSLATDAIPRPARRRLRREHARRPWPKDWGGGRPAGWI